MLLEFKVENFLSFKDMAEFSMLSDTSKSSKKESKDAVTTLNKLNILKSAAIFGANASGKSNLLRAIDVMIEKVLSDRTNIDKFALSEETDDKPSLFEITFITKARDVEAKNEYITFRYGFEIKDGIIVSEWLFGRFTASESTLFIREGSEIKLGDKFKEGKQFIKASGKINESKLLIHLIQDLKGTNAPINSLIIRWFKRLGNITFLVKDNFHDITTMLMDYEDSKECIIKALKAADTSIDNIIIEEKQIDIDELPIFIKDKLKNDDKKELKTEIVKSIHTKYDLDGNPKESVEFNFDKQESEGTKKFFTIIGPVLHTLSKGFILVIDEIDARLHPNLCEAIISLFNNPNTNKKNAQLIFATHNANIMTRDMLRRDQIYLVEKDKYGASELYSLLDYKKVRSDATYNKDYLMGKYGGVPYLGNFESLFSEE
jgi:AAA15 family ATPase/GTPase